MTLRVLHKLRRRIKTQRLTVEQPCQKSSRFITFQPRAEIDEQRKTRRVAFRKAIFAEAFDLFADARDELGFIASLEHAVGQILLILRQIAGAPPRGHRASQLVGLLTGIFGRNHREVHHLFLENRHAERALEHWPQLIFSVVLRLDTLLATQIRMHHAPLDRAGPHDRDFDHEIVVLVRFQPRQHALLRTRFDLKYADRIGMAAHFVDGSILARNILHPECRKAAPQCNELQRAPDGRQHAERQHVDFQ